MRALLLACLLMLAGSLPASAAQSCASIEFFYHSSCPHCVLGLDYLERLERERPAITVQRFEVTTAPQAMARLLSLSQARGLARPAVPTFLICEKLLVGFDESRTPADIARLLDGAPAGPSAGERGFTSKLFGELSVDDLGLPLFTIAIGLVDGFNPCAMWVLLFLLSILMNVRSRRRIALIAGVFVLASAAMYYAFMAAWLNAFAFVGFARPLQIGIGIVAVLMGAIHIKDYFALGSGPSLSIPEAAKAGIYARVRRIVNAEALGGALASVIALAIAVNLIELLCTAGLPALYTHILSLEPIGMAARHAYLLLYNLAYIFDDTLVVVIAVVTLRRIKLQPRQGRWLKLASGAVLAGLGAMLVLAPGWLL